jgi:DNA (cytosine-5)-methyltransferase 1
MHHQPLIESRSHYPGYSFTFVDLFAGMGGFKLALSRNGGQCVGFSEINQDAIQVYCDNFGIDPSLNLGDIRHIKNLPPHDFLTAGVPCQSWSIAGKNLGFDDDRGQLWNDTLYLLQKSQPKAFLFENVKGLGDPRNHQALNYILGKIRTAGYYAHYWVINSFDYGVPQNRLRIYIIGFQNQDYFQRFILPQPQSQPPCLGEVLGLSDSPLPKHSIIQGDLFGYNYSPKAMSLSHTNGFNDYFLFNDLRNGHSTIHSWDIIPTNDRQKFLCLLLLKNRRKSAYGKLDGNPLSLQHFQDFDSSIDQQDLDDLVALGIFAPEEYCFGVSKTQDQPLTGAEKEILSFERDGLLEIDDLKTSKLLKLKKIPILPTLAHLKEKQIIHCLEVRYDFKNTKISTGLFGVNRVFLPNSKIFPTLVASDAHDFIALETIVANNHEDFKRQFLDRIYKPKKFRKITQEEACLIQGFPRDFQLPSARGRWMKLLGNSVAVPVVEQLCRAIVATGVFAS